MQIRGVILLLIFMPLFAGLAVRAGDGGVTYQGGDGSTEAKAILIVGAKDDFSATHAEYVYLGRHFPNYHLDSQALMSAGNKSYDMLAFDDARGAPHHLYFDITATLGK
jgi:predicted RNA-binding protein associated with RNAse of E/G family